MSKPFTTILPPGQRVFIFTVAKAAPGFYSFEMTSGALLLLLSAFFHAGWNALAKSSKDKESYLFITMFLGGIFSFIALLIFEGLKVPTSSVFWAALGSGVFEGLYLFTLAKTLRNSALGTSYAIMRGGAMILVWIFSLTFLGERALPLQYVGAGLVLFGIFTMNWADFHWRTEFTKKNIWAYLSAVFITGYHLCYHKALHENAEPLSLFTISVFVSLPLVYLGIGSNKLTKIKDTLKHNPKSVLATGILSTLSFVIFLYGLRLSGPGFAISLRNTSIFFAILFSYLLKESLSRTQIIGACIIGIGAFCLSI